jgi:hypothetical protein
MSVDVGGNFLWAARDRASLDAPRRTTLTGQRESCPARLCPCKHPVSFMERNFGGSRFQSTVYRKGAGLGDGEGRRGKARNAQHGAQHRRF